MGVKEISPTSLILCLEHSIILTTNDNDSIFLHYGGEYHQFNIDDKQQTNDRLWIHIKDPDEKLWTRLDSDYNDLLLEEGVEGLYNGNMIKFNVHSIGLGIGGSKRRIDIELIKPGC